MNILFFFYCNFLGTWVVVWNERGDKIYNASTVNLAASFMAPAYAGSDFGSAAFSANGKTVYLQGSQTIFIQQANGFRTGDTLSVPGQWTTYGSPAKPFLEMDFSWEQLVLSKDNRYLFLLCRPLAGELVGAKPFLVRKEVGDRKAQTFSKILYR